MRHFETKIDYDKGIYDAKDNFVDANNSFVGFDAESSCCEDFGWIVSPKPFNSDGDSDGPDWDCYTFDTTYFEEKDDEDGNEHSWSSGGQVAFRLVASGKPDLFLTLYNHHNGYYSHGFEFTVGGIKVQSSL